MEAYSCNLCSVSFASQQALAVHNMGKTHLRLVQQKDRRELSRRRAEAALPPGGTEAAALQEDEPQLPTVEAAEASLPAVDDPESALPSTAPTIDQGQAGEKALPDVQAQPPPSAPPTATSLAVDMLQPAAQFQVAGMRDRLLKQAQHNGPVSANAEAALPWSARQLLPALVKLHPSLRDHVLRTLASPEFKAEDVSAHWPNGTELHKYLDSGQVNSRVQPHIPGQNSPTPLSFTGTVPPLILFITNTPPYSTYVRGHYPPPSFYSDLALLLLCICETSKYAFATRLQHLNPWCIFCRAFRRTMQAPMRRWCTPSAVS